VTVVIWPLKKLVWTAPILHMALPVTPAFPVKEKNQISHVLNVGGNQFAGN
jgi:hypothetical protein